jgi:hypothetical protein
MVRTPLLELCHQQQLAFSLIFVRNTFDCAFWVTTNNAATLNPPPRIDHIDAIKTAGCAAMRNGADLGWLTFAIKK